jgi:hypothetical protein
MLDCRQHGKIRKIINARFIDSTNGFCIDYVVKTSKHMYNSIVAKA